MHGAAARCRFNPHPRVEGDAHWAVNCRLLDGFNPHPRVEGDYAMDWLLGERGVSIHTLAWRVTHSEYIQYYRENVSIHTLAWRVTALAKSYAATTIVSIHTLAWRVTL